MVKNMNSAGIISILIRVYGIVQGVGFRPTVSRHALSSGINGTVCNKGSYVEIIAQGSSDACGSFVRLLKTKPPARAEIIRLTSEIIDEAETYDSFSIIDSSPTEGDIYISPDIAICEDCKRELFDKNNRRYLHPFINCTNCGPRMTILDGLPYDRERTSMKEFPMCRTCSQEYLDPFDRRYDAQPVCCNECGPEVYILENEIISGSQQISSSEGLKGQKYLNERNKIRGREALTMTRRVIADGGIAAIKGIGGFHLCCSALDAEAVALLRKRKRRMTKPFAVMVRDIDTVRRECLTNDAAEEIITGHKKPILLLPKKAGGIIPEIVAPDNQKLGVMLPYAPVQLLLFDYDDNIQMPDSLVMTSANDSGAPICRSDEDALRELGGLCDIILSNNRQIRVRADDSVMELYEGKPYMIRRSRGYAPLPFLVSQAPGNGNINQSSGNGNTSQTLGIGNDLSPVRNLLRDNPKQGRTDPQPCANVHNNASVSVLGIGGELKNSFCIAKNDLFYLSPYVGDLEDVRTCDAMSETLDRFLSMLEATPEVIVCDPHPLYHSRDMAYELADKYGAKLYEVQHHYAHILSCIAENNFSDPVIGISFDGTGYGNGGKIWGGEILLADTDGFRRIGTISEFPQSGGDASAKEGWRIAISMLLSSYGEERACGIAQRLHLCSGSEFTALSAMIKHNINCIGSTSAGRLFDAISAILGIRRVSDYEGEAATSLMCAAERFLASASETEDGDCMRSSHAKDVSVITSMCRYPSLTTMSRADDVLTSNRFRDCIEINAVNRHPALPKAMTYEHSEGMEPYHIHDGLAVMNTAGLFELITELRLEGIKSTDELAYIFHVFLGDIIVKTLVGLRDDKSMKVLSDHGSNEYGREAEETNEPVCAISRERLEMSALESPSQIATSSTSDRADELLIPNTVALSGGVFQNLLLLDIVKRGLEDAGFNVLIHSLVPPNDGGIALGQALYGTWAYQHTND